MATVQVKFQSCQEFPWRFGAWNILLRSCQDVRVVMQARLGHLGVNENIANEDDFCLNVWI
jgi:phosphatidate phosphatase PAH1